MLGFLSISGMPSSGSLIALARAARDTPLIIEPYKDLLLELGLKGSPHVLIRAFASSAGLGVLRSEAVDRQSELELRFGRCEHIAIPGDHIRSVLRFKPQQSVPEDEERKDPFYFDIDAGTHWFAPGFARRPRLHRHAGLAKARPAVRVDRCRPVSVHPGPSRVWMQHGRGTEEWRVAPAVTRLQLGAVWHYDRRKHMRVPFAGR
jgi:hypothetical protein